MLQQLASLIRDGRLSGLIMKIELINDKPVIQLSCDTPKSSHALFEKGDDDTKNMILAIRQAIATPIIFQGENLEQKIKESIPLLRTSHAAAQNTLDSLNVAAKLDGAVANVSANTKIKNDEEPKAAPPEKKEQAAEPQAQKEEVQHDLYNFSSL